MTRQNQWNDNRERMQTQMETMGSEEESENEQSLLDSIQVENEERYDYRQFLRKFAVLREEMQIRHFTHTAFPFMGICLL